MSEPIAIVVPSLDRTLHGRLYPADEPVCGLALLEGAGATSPALARIYDELAAYMRAAGVTVLRLEGQRARYLSEQVPDILAALSALRSLDVQRMVLVAPALREEADEVDVAARIFMRFVETVATQEKTTASAGRSIAELTDALALVSEHLAGVAVLVLAQQTADERRRRVRRAGTFTLSPTSTDSNKGRSRGALPRLVVPVSTADAAGTAVTAVISKLYMWATRTLAVTAAMERPVAAAAPEAPAPPDVGGAVAGVEEPRPGLGVARARHLNERWVSLLERLEARAPARAARVRELLAGSNRHGDPSAVRSAGRAWRALDHEARIEWLHVCAEVFALRVSSQRA